ncbi:MAG: SDR family NAD(P)-dependent oxidoreductase [Pseudomonadota bacterium]
MKTALVTGSAGFIGFHTAERLLHAGWRVVGLDAMTDYYDVTLKEARHDLLKNHEHFTSVVERVEAPGVLRDLLADARPNAVIHLAAQAGVRYSIEAPRSYVDANITGTFELLEALRATPVAHALIASTSSVYGANTDMPYSESDKADSQMSFYAATKKATEAMAHSYAHLYDLPITMFRFFTVYGPWGRPDMAIFLFTRAILSGEPIKVFNHGKSRRDFTYVDDLVAGVSALIDKPPAKGLPVDGDSLSAVAPFRVVNIGNAQPVELMDFIKAVEGACGREAVKEFLPLQPGDVPATWADTRLLNTLTGSRPATPVTEGVGKFVDWYRTYYEI